MSDGDAARYSGELCSYEVRILRCAANGVPGPWGAAVGQALETLRKGGYMTKLNQVTRRGHYALAFHAGMKHAYELCEGQAAVEAALRSSSGQDDMADVLDALADEFKERASDG